MLVLCSDGMTSEKIRTAVKNSIRIVSGKSAIVTTASDFCKERDDNVPVIRRQFEEMGLTSECIDLEFQDVSLLLQYDAVMFLGGNPFYLLKHLKKWERSWEIMHEIAWNKTLVGFSAGSMVWGNTIDFADALEPEMLDAVDHWPDYDCYAFADLNLMPHYKAYLTCFPGIDQLVASYERETGRKITTINDKEAIICNLKTGKCRYIKDDSYIPVVEKSWKHRKKEAYLFDLYGTLVDIHTDEAKKELWEKLALFYGYYGAGYDPQEMKHCYDIFVREEESDCAAHSGEGACVEIQLEKVFLRLFKNRNVSVEPAVAVMAGQLFRVLSTNYIRPYYGAKELIRSLKRAGKQVYLLSNAQAIFTRYELRHLGMDGLFDDIFLSSDYSRKKPDPDFFAALCQKHGLNLKKTVMVGNDYECDIEPAQALGMATVYIHSNLSPELWKEPKTDLFFKTMDLPLLQELTQEK